jgi:hypothetical protein
MLATALPLTAHVCGNASVTASSRVLCAGRSPRQPWDSWSDTWFPLASETFCVSVRTSMSNLRTRNFHARPGLILLLHQESQRSHAASTSLCTCPFAGVAVQSVAHEQHVRKTLADSALKNGFGRPSRPPSRAVVVFARGVGVGEVRGS